MSTEEATESETDAADGVSVMDDRRAYVTVSEALTGLASLDAGESGETPDHEACNHRSSTVETYDSLDFGECPHDGYSPRRCYPHGVSWAITVSGRKTPIHYAEPRMLTVREVARLQSFDDDFSFPSETRTGKFRVIGNAVPPDLASSVAEAIPV